MHIKHKVVDCIYVSVAVEYKNACTCTYAALSVLGQFVDME